MPCPYTESEGRVGAERSHPKAGNTATYRNDGRGRPSSSMEGRLQVRQYGSEARESSSSPAAGVAPHQHT